MNRAAATSSRPTRAVRLGALHAQGGKWRLVVFEANGALRLIESATLDAGDTGALDAVLHRLRASVLVRLVPGNATVARAVRVPDAGAGDLALALRLIAEAQLPEGIPPHRRAAGIVHGAAHDVMRTALVTGWTPTDNPARACRDLPEVWTTELAALAAVADRASPVAGYANRSAGAISLLAFGREQMLARVLLEDGSDEGTWRAALDRALTETGEAISVEAPPAPRGPEPLFGTGTSHLRARIEGLPGDETWLSEFALAVGAVLVASSEDPCVRGLASLSSRPPEQDDPFYLRLAAWAQRRAGVFAAACLVLALGLPIAAAGARLAILSAKTADLKSLDEQLAQDQRRAAIYRHLEKSRWPMSKLMADVAVAAPVGVVIETLRLSPDQGLVIQGTADSDDLVSTLQANLASTGVFGSPQIDRSETTPDGVSFSVSATVQSPHAAAKVIEDFAAKPLAERLYGPGASNDATEEPRRAASGDTDGDRRRGASGEDDDRAGVPVRSSGGEIPAEVTDEQIGAMTFAQAGLERAKRRTALSKNPSLDEPTKARLTAEMEKLMARMDATRGGGSG